LLRRALIAPLAVASVSVAALASSHSVALASSGGGPVWQSPQNYTAAGSSAVFEAATCETAGNCLAAGASTGSTQISPLIVASSNGSWGMPATATVNGGVGDSFYSSVACMSANTCVGVGYSSDSTTNAYEPLAGWIAVSGTTVAPAALNVLPLPAGDGNATEQATLASVSCTASSCAAVGSYLTNADVEKPLVAQYSNGAWSVGSPSAPAAATKGADLTAVSCPSDGACEAVGSYLDAGGDGQSWAVQLSGSETGQTITPPAGATNAAGVLPVQPGASPYATEGMDAISCPSVDACTAVGTYYDSSPALPSMAVKIDNGVFGVATAVQPPTPLVVNEMTGIWCADADDCIVSGFTETTGVEVTPVTGYETAGAWSALTSVPGAVTGTPTTGAQVPDGLGCSALDYCLSVGYDDSESGVTPMFSFSAAPLSVGGATLASATIGTPYSATLPSNGGVGAPDWSIKGGALPAGLSLNAATGVISGTPTAVGTVSFTIQLEDGGPPAQSTTAAFSITVAAKAAGPGGAPPAAGKASLAVGKITASSVTLTVACAGSGGCKGSAMVTAVEHFKGKKLTSVAAHVKSKLVKITLARGSYSVPSGRSAKVTLKLTGKAKALLNRLHKLSGQLTLTPTGAKKPTMTRTVTFKSAVKKKRKK
jgi:hypothetical protein